MRVVVDPGTYSETHAELSALIAKTLAEAGETGRFETLGRFFEMLVERGVLPLTDIGNAMYVTLEEGEHF